MHETIRSLLALSLVLLSMAHCVHFELFGDMGHRNDSLGVHAAHAVEQEDVDELILGCRLLVLRGIL